MKRLSPIDSNALQIDNLADPSAAQDAATKRYADAVGYSGGIEHPQYATARMTYINDGNAAWDDFYASGDGSLDTSSFVTGTGSVKVTTQTLNTYAGVSKELSPAVNLATKNIRLWVKASNWSLVNQCTLILSSNSYTLTNSYTLDIKTRLINPPNGEWIEVVVPRSAFVVDGSPNWASINLMLFRVRDTNTSFVNVSIDSMASFDEGSRGLVSITFDDGYDDTATEGKKYLDKYGYPATAYIVPSVLGTAGYLSQAQVDSLAAVGWDISGHSLSNLTSLTSTQLEDDLRTTKEYLVGKGYRGSDHYAFPNGAYNAAVVTNVKKYFSSGVNIDGFNGSLTHVSPYRINRQSIDKFTTTGMVQAWIDSALANKEWAIINFHTLVATEVDDQDWTITKFQTIVDYLNTVGATVRTVSDVLDHPPSSQNQPLDSDLTAVAALSPSNDDVIQRKSGAWTNRTMAQLKTDLSLGNVDNTSDATKNSATATLTNKRLTPRIGTTTSSATPSINTDNVDQYNITALAAAITSMTTNLTGTPTDGQKLMIRIKDNGTARTVAWGSSFVSTGTGTLLASTVANKTHLVGLIYDSAAAKWACVGCDHTGY